MELKESLKQIKDFRIDRCKKHDLVEILLIVLIGMLCGYKNIEEIQLNAELSEDFLKKYLKLENGVPSADTILRVLAGIDSKQPEKVFCEYTKGIFKEQLPQQEIVAIDGKTIRRSATDTRKAAHVVSAFASSLGVCFGQVKTEEKSNEITAIPELLDLLNLKGVIVTIDAMGCQKKIAQKITEKRSDYLFSLKGNQEKIHKDVKDFFNHELDEKYCERYKIQHFSCGVEKDHGRIERRDYYLCTNLKWLAQKDEWAGLNGIGMVKCHRQTKNGETTDVRYFITSLKDVTLAAKAMRSHWSVENKLHWILDTVFDEDYCRVRKDNSAQNLNIIRKITMNLLAATDFSDIIKKTKIPLSHKRTLCIKRENCLLRVLQNL